MSELVEQVKNIYASVGMDVPIIMASSPAVGAFLAPILANKPILDEKVIKLAKDHAKRLVFTQRQGMIGDLINQYVNVLSHGNKKPESWCVKSQPGSTNTAFLRAWREYRDKQPLRSGPPIPDILSDFAKRRIHTLWGRRVKYHPIVWLPEPNNVMWPNRRFAVISDPPLHLIRNNNLQLHSTADLALKWKDGWGAAFISGIRISNRYVLKPETLTMDVINRTSNVETKRALMELYGFERWLTDTNAKLIHEDVDRVNKPRRLWELMNERFGDLRTWRNPVHVNLLEVVNSTPELDGSYKKYFLQVPGNITTVEAARAWMRDDQQNWDVEFLIET